MNFSMTGSIVLVSALLASKAEHKGELRLVGVQADGDLGLKAAFLGEAGLAEPVILAGLEIQGADVVEH
jgi:hypothetical protein